MNPREKLAILGSGPSSLYLLKHLLDESELLKHHLGSISIFEKSHLTGFGMPYSPQTTDRFNMANISSQELPELPVSLADWLRRQDPQVLQELDLENEEISESKIYSRLALGKYLHAQYHTLLSALAECGIEIQEYPGCEVIDVKDNASAEEVRVRTASGTEYGFDKVVIATGHCWPEEDRPERGYYASPWPIFKLLPEETAHHPFVVGTLGASLSAFDVVSSLAHRHGSFVQEPKGLVFHPHPGTEDFKIIMHAAHGRLPHLQFDLEEKTRVIYRHIDREGMLGLVDAKGFLRIDRYFDEVCRPALTEAFQKDEMADMVARLADPKFGFRDFVETMSHEHDYANAFEGMRYEMIEAEESVFHHQPIHWKETIDDLIYTLNFHGELLPAEDHLVLQSLVMPFLMNVIAAMPLRSGNTLLALYDAGKLEIVSGKVTIAEEPGAEGMTTIVVNHEDEESTMSYRMFVDCSGQKGLELEDYPFPSLVAEGTVRSARARFDHPEGAIESLAEEKRERVFREGDDLFYPIGGVDIDGTYRLIGSDGQPNPRIYDIAFPHTSGVRPYSYGLQSCSDTGAILVRAWVKETEAGAPLAGGFAEISQMYEEL